MNCKPDEALCKIVNDLKQPATLRARCASELLQYLHPKLRNVEHVGADGGPIQGRAVLEVVYVDTDNVPE